MRSLVLIAHDIRSTHNVGSLFRTADGFGVTHIYLSGITPYPQMLNDERLPHIIKKLANQIDKTALGSTKTITWSYHSNITEILVKLKKEGYKINGLEQTKTSKLLHKFKPSDKCAILLGNEVSGISNELLKMCDDILEIKMYGKKESFNVVQAAAITLYALREA